MNRLLALIICLGILSACSTITIDRGNFGPFKRSLNSKSYGYLVLEDPTKSAPVNMIEVFEVRPGDCGTDPGWSDCRNDRERSELSEVNKDNRPGSEYWYGWYIYFPQDYPNIYPTKVALGQFHQDKSHPVWMFQNGGGGYKLDDQVHGYSRDYYKLIDESELRGKWHKIEVQVRWAKNEKGYFRVWVNGVQKVDYIGQTMDANRVYFKYGLYRSFISRSKKLFYPKKVPAQKVYFANVKRGKSREDLMFKIDN